MRKWTWQVVLALTLVSTTSAQVPVMVADINRGPGPSTPRWFGGYSGRVYFQAIHPDVGRELFCSDGSSVELVADLFPGPEHAAPQDPVEFQGELYFGAYSPTEGSTLWRFDGANLSPAAKTSLFRMSHPHLMTVFGSELVFRARDPIHGYEVWAFDGQETYRLANLAKGGQHSSPGPFLATDDKLYFGATSTAYGSVPVRTLWIYDGTSLRSVRPPRGYPSNGPGFITAYGGDVYFRLSFPAVGSELGRFDGTAISLAADVPSTHSHPELGAVFRGELFFGARGPEPLDRELWAFNGSTARKVADIYPGPGGSAPFDFVTLDGNLYFSGFSADPTAEGRVLYKYDGQAVTRIAPHLYDVDGLTRVGDTIYFGADDGIHGNELWKLEAP